ncbi:LPXTG cell wall anchor domain-containing protein, partial [Varibaculum cambriense]|uniref:LPXTG cell wall anchor domain-containing protein n=1 Tax=Varibaculum cambriense TaxID=184870 RepID=UPI00288A64CD
GKMDEETVKKGDSFKLPANGFAPPAGKEFNGWQIDGKTYKVGESITVNGDVTVKALWKDKPASSSTTPGKDKPGKQGKSQPQNPASGGNLSKTGANGTYSLYASLLLLATGGLFVISRRRRAQR